MPRFHRKVIHIRAEDSPNVAYSLAEQETGQAPSGQVIVPGVLPWDKYTYRRKHWDPVLQCIGLDGLFYEGAMRLLYPPQWLNLAEEYAKIIAMRKRTVLGIGVDPGEGEAETALAAVDEFGVVAAQAEKTPDTNKIPRMVYDFMGDYRCPAERVCIDIGGGGKQLADRMRAKGYRVRPIGFGSGISLTPRRGMNTITKRIDTKEQQYNYKNRRAQMYGDLRDLLRPDTDDAGRLVPCFGIPKEQTELRRQLAPIPLWYDEEGCIYLPPKQRRTGDLKGEELLGLKNDPNKITMNSLIGCSPDRADALVLAVHAMLHQPEIFVVRSMV